jgi:hypothetical protein
MSDHDSAHKNSEKYELYLPGDSLEQASPPTPAPQPPSGTALKLSRKERLANWLHEKNDLSNWSRPTRKHVLIIISIIIVLVLVIGIGGKVIREYPFAYSTSREQVESPAMKTLVQGLFGTEAPTSEQYSTMESLSIDKNQDGKYIYTIKYKQYGQESQSISLSYPYKGTEYGFDIKDLQCFHNLKEIRLEYNSSRANNINLDFSMLPNLETMVLGENVRIWKNMVADPSKIQELGFHATDEDEYSELNEFENVHTLHITSGAKGDTGRESNKSLLDFERISRLPDLETLTISNDDDFQLFFNEASSLNIKELNIPATSLTAFPDETKTSITDIHRKFLYLESLAFNTMYANTWDYYSNTLEYNHIEEMSFRSLSFTESNQNNSLASLSLFPSLKTLEISSIDDTASDPLLDVIPSLTHLEKLSLGVFTPQNITDKTFSTLDDLTSVSISTKSLNTVFPLIQDNNLSNLSLTQIPEDFIKNLIHNLVP